MAEQDGCGEGVDQHSSGVGVGQDAEQVLPEREHPFAEHRPAKGACVDPRERRSQAHHQHWRLELAVAIQARHKSPRFQRALRRYRRRLDPRQADQQPPPFGPGLHLRQTELLAPHHLQIADLPGWSGSDGVADGGVVAGGECGGEGEDSGGVVGVVEGVVGDEVGEEGEVGAGARGAGGGGEEGHRREVYYCD